MPRYDIGPHAAISFLLALTLLGLSHLPAWAHEVIIKPERFTATVGQPLDVRIISTEVFMVGNEIEPVGRIEAFYVQGESSQPVSLTPNEAASSLDATITPEKVGMAILAAHRQSIIWTKTGDGWQQGPKSQYPGALKSGNYEKFSKTLIAVDTGEAMHQHVVGHRLELVPLNDPTTLSVGREAVLRVLYDGKPLSAQVLATYDGFSKHPDTYAYATQSTDNGIAHVKLTHAGTWIVRVQHKVPAASDDYDEHIFRAVLAFAIAP